MKYRKLVSMLMASVLLVTGIQPGSMLSVSAETEPAEAALSGAEPLATSDNSFGAMLAAGINEQQAQIQSGCNIYNVEMFGNAARVHFDASRDGKLVVALYEDIGGEQAPRLIGTGMQEVAAGEQQDEYVTISTFASMPEYYLIRAYLIGSNGMPLSPEYENPMHTKEMINLLGSDINDYAGYEVLNLDDDVNTNFAVYNTDVTVLKSSSTENVVTEQDPETGVYKISNYTGPTRSGEFVSIEGDGNSVTIFKIKSVTKSGSVTTVYANTDAETSDAFAFIKIETDSSAAKNEYTPPDPSELPEGFTISKATVSDSGQQKKRPLYHAASEKSETETEEEKHFINGFTIRLQIGKEETDYTPISKGDHHNENTVGANGSVEIDIQFDFQYYQGKFFHHYDLNIDSAIDFNVEFYASFSKIIPLGGVGSDTFAGVEFHLGPYLYLTIKAAMEIGFSASASYYSDGGFTGDISPIDAELSGEFEVGFGLGVGADILDIAQAHVDFMIGGRAEIMTTNKHNDCTRCAEGNLYFEITASAGIGLNFLKPAVFEKGKGWELGGEVKIELLTAPFYISDVLGFGWGECPNKIEKPEKDPEEDPEKDPEEEPDDGLTDEQRAMFSFKLYKDGYELSLKASKYGPERFQSASKTRELRSGITSLDMPDYYKGQPVTAIARYAFNMCENLQTQNIKFPSHLKRIREYAFANCYSLSGRFEFPDSVEEIENIGLRSSKIEELVLPPNITVIPKSAFSEMKYLKTVTIPEGVTTIESYAFADCRDLKTVKFPNSLTDIGDCAFCRVRDLHIELPPNIRTIGEKAFAAESVPSINSVQPVYTLTIPESLQYVGRKAFYNNHNIKKLILPKYYTGQVYDFSYMRNVTEYEIPENWTEIPSNIFTGSAITSFEILPKYTKIGDYAFSGTNISEITIPDTIKEIGAEAFVSCPLKTIRIPSSVTKIEDGVFGYCDLLESVEIPSSVTSIGECTFANCTSLKTIDIPSSVTEIGTSAFGYCENLETLVIPASVQKMNFDALQYCPKLKSVTFLNPNIEIQSEPDDFINYLSGDLQKWYFKQLVIYGYESSTAQQFATDPDHKFSFKALKNPVTGTTPAGTTPVTEPEQPKDEPKTITFTDLKPNTIYNFYDLLGDEFIAENLLYLSQGVSDENGTLTIWYRPAKDDTDANKFVKRFVSQPVITVAGDLTCDGHVDVSDAVALLRFLNEDKSVKISDQGITNADANRNGQVDSDDCTVILQFIARIIREI